jgi:hypothetical protein
MDRLWAEMIFYSIHETGLIAQHLQLLFETDFSYVSKVPIHFVASRLFILPVSVSILNDHLVGMV